MTEAFEIGVSLALQDGVSDAVVKARRDVASLEHAVRESGVSLRALHSAGTKAASVSFVDAGKQDGDGAGRRFKGGTEPGEKAATVSVPASALLAGQAAMPGRGVADGQSVDLGKMAGGDKARPDTETALGHFSKPVDVFSRVNEHAPGKTTHTDFDHVPTRVALAKNAEIVSGVGPFAFAPRVVADDSASGLHDTRSLPAYDRDSVIGRGAAAPHSAFEDGGNASGVSAPISLVSALLSSGGAPGGDRNEQLSSQADEGAGDDTQAGPMRQASFPGAAVGSGAPAAGAAVVGGAAPQHGQQGAAGPQEGDVFLDGVLVGRWMSRFLTREAERASAGPTGFDARRGRLLPGVTVGG